jgi:hypothetical protein
MAALSEVEERQAEREAELGLMVSGQRGRCIKMGSNREHLRTTIPAESFFFALKLLRELQSAAPMPLHLSPHIVHSPRTEHS